MARPTELQYLGELNSTGIFSFRVSTVLEAQRAPSLNPDYTQDAEKCPIHVGDEDALGIRLTVYYHIPLSFLYFISISSQQLSLTKFITTNNHANRMLRMFRKAEGIMLQMEV
jgi:hypothetical protein